MTNQVLVSVLKPQIIDNKTENNTIKEEICLLHFVKHLLLKIIH